VKQIETSKRKVIVNFSGGKDSTVAILEVLKRYPKDEVLLCWQDTGAEYLETESHVRLIAQTLGLPLEIQRAKRDFWEAARHRKFFPTPVVRHCTSDLKRDVFNKWLTTNFKGKGYEVIVVSGIRAEESRSRSKLHEWENPQGHKIVTTASKLWYPCLNMSYREVMERVKSEGLPLHPCYDFAMRCSCWCCIFGKYNEVRTYAEAHPDLYEKACLVEDEIKCKWKYRFGFSDLMKQGRLV